MAIITPEHQIEKSLVANPTHMYLNRITEFDILEKDILHPVGNAKLRYKQNVYALLAGKGTRYTGKLMVVGRAGNGWGEGIALSDLAVPEERKRYAQEVFDEFHPSDGVCPMQWLVNAWNRRGYWNARTRSFWGVISKVVERLDIVEEEDFDETWASHIVWSNLYKVAPVKGGNPSERLCNEQLDGCKKLLDYEIRTYKPERLLFITERNTVSKPDYFWADDFLPDDDDNDIQWDDDKGFVQASGYRTLAPDMLTRVVVAKRPEFRKEDDWVDQVVSMFV